MCHWVHDSDPDSNETFRRDSFDRHRSSNLARVTGAVLTLGGLAIASRAGAPARWSTLDEFLTNGIRLSAQERMLLARGGAVARTLPTAPGAAG